MFCCNFCGYKSNRKFNIQKHIKNIHNRDTNDKELNNNVEYVQKTTDEVQNTTYAVQNTTDEVQNTTKSVKITTESVKITTKHKNEIFCPGCQKVFKTSQGLKRHQTTCKGVSNNLECHHCHKVFTKQQAKSRHLKICKMKEVKELVATQLQTHNITNNTQNNTNNTNNMQNITVHYHNYRAPYHPHEYYDKDEYYNIENVNDFGKEDISYIPDEEMLRIALNYDIKSLIAQKHFNPLHPENHNIRTNCNKSYKILKDRIWTIETKDAVHSIIYNNSQCKIQDYAHIHLINKLLDSEKTEEYLDRMTKINEKPKIKRMNNFIDIKIKERNQNVLRSNIKNTTIGRTNPINEIDFNEPIMITAE